MHKRQRFEIWFLSVEVFDHFARLRARQRADRVNQLPSRLHRLRRVRQQVFLHLGQLPHIIE